MRKKPDVRNKTSRKIPNEDFKSPFKDHDYVKDIIQNEIAKLLSEEYEQRKIHAQAVTPLDTIQKRITEMHENQYFITNREIDYKKLSLRKGYIHIKLK
jgi:hypothetical protein